MLSIERRTQEIRDPQSGQVVRVLTEKFGEVRVIDVDEVSAVCSVITGEGIRVVGYR